MNMVLIFLKVYIYTLITYYWIITLEKKCTFDVLPNVTINMKKKYLHLLIDK